MSKKTCKRTTEKMTSEIQALDDEALKGIVGGTGQDDSNKDDDEDEDSAWFFSPGPWD